MTETTEITPPPILDALHEALEQKDQDRLTQLLSEAHPSEVAHLLASLPAKQRLQLWHAEGLQQSELLAYVDDNIRAELMADMEAEEVAAATEQMDTDDAVDLLQDLPDDRIEEVLQAMDELRRLRLTQILSYPEDTAGGLMNTDTLTVRLDLRLATVLRYLRRHEKLPEKTEALIVVDMENRYQGMLFLTDLITQDGELKVREVMSQSVEPISAHISTHEVARIFEHRDLLTSPVVDENGVLLGRITVDDVMDVIRAEAEHALMSRAGLDEEDDMFASIATTTRNRALWLGINLLTAFLAAWVIGQFEATLDQVVALAVLMPIVASMGGIAGTQTLTVVIRGIALDKVNNKNARWLLRKEIAVGLLNGVLWAIVIAGMAILWFHNYMIGAVIGAAIVINLFFAAFSGMLIPLLLKRLSIDPALAGGVILTTVTDVIGFGAFLGLATLFILSN
jgi:magnesium transporter